MPLKNLRLESEEKNAKISKKSTMVLIKTAGLAALAAVFRAVYPVSRIKSHLWI